MNKYQPSQGSVAKQVSESLGGRAFSGDCFRQGKQWVVRRNASLPGTCPITNESTDFYEKYRLGLDPLLLQAMVVAGGSDAFAPYKDFNKRKGELMLPLSRRLKRRRTMISVVAVVIALISLTSLTYGILYERTLRDTWTGIFVGSGLVGILVTLLVGVFASRPISYASGDYDFVWLKGASRKFLDGLPEFPATYVARKSE